MDEHHITTCARSISLKIGEPRQVALDVLSFCFENIAIGTRLEGATLKISVVPVSGACENVTSQ